MQICYVKDANFPKQKLYVHLQVPKSDIDILKSEVQHACKMSDTFQREMDYVTSERQGLLARIEELSKELASSNRWQVWFTAHRLDSITDIVVTIHSH